VHLQEQRNSPATAAGRPAHFLFGKGNPYRIKHPCCQTILTVRSPERSNSSAIKNPTISGGALT